MKLKIPVKGRKKFLVIVNLLDTFSPYNQLSPKEKEVYADLLYYNAKLSYIEDVSKRNKLIFDYDTRKEIGQRLGIKPSNIYNVMASLRRKGIIDKKSFINKYVIGDIDDLSFIFDDK